LLFGYGINDYVQTQSSVFTNSIWIHVAVVYDANQLTDPEKVKIYVNGINQQLDFSNPVANSLDATNSNVRIASSSDDDRFFSGQIDDVRIYNYALTPTQIKTIMNSGTVNFQ